MTIPLVKMYALVWFSRQFLKKLLEEGVRMANRGSSGAGCGCMSLAMVLVFCLSLVAAIAAVLAFVPFSSGQTESSWSNHQRGDTIARGVVYFYDERTGLCFARNSTEGSGITLVPYDKVKDVLLNPPDKPPE